MMTLRW